MSWALAGAQHSVPFWYVAATKLNPSRDATQPTINNTHNRHYHTPTHKNTRRQEQMQYTVIHYPIVHGMRSLPERGWQKNGRARACSPLSLLKQSVSYKHARCTNNQATSPRASDLRKQRGKARGGALFYPKIRVYSRHFTLPPTPELQRPIHSSSTPACLRADHKTRRSKYHR